MMVFFMSNENSNDYELILEKKAVQGSNENPKYCDIFEYPFQ